MNIRHFQAYKHSKPAQTAAQNDFNTRRAAYDQAKSNLEAAERRVANAIKRRRTEQHLGQMKTLLAQARTVFDNAEQAYHNARAALDAADGLVRARGPRTTNRKG